MDTAIGLGHPRAPARTVLGLPWYVVAMGFGATSVVVGVIWDISWHRTIGRDSFWTPAHMAIYLGGVVCGLCGGWLALKTTFAGTDVELATAVRFWGFRAPLGAWVAIWGAIAMLTSAPFDDWWHNAYGLDVEILSPPHTLLALGMGAVTIGALLLAAAQQNRGDAAGPGFGLAFAYIAGVLIALVAVMGTDYRWTNEQHQASFYIVSCAVYPLYLIACTRTARLRWPATTIAAFYMLINLAMIWILPLFPGEPLLAPIYRPVDRMVVDAWPLILVVPALALDLVLRWWGDRGDWRLTVFLAVAFLAVFLFVQWNFSTFVVFSDWTDNWFFAADRQWGYESRPGAWEKQFWGEDLKPVSIGIALIAALISTRLGLWWGSWMRRVQR